MSTGGRPCKSIWLEVFGTSKSKSTYDTCIFCKSIVKHNGKSRSVELHLSKCPNYNISDDSCSVVTRTSTERKPVINNYFPPGLSENEKRNFHEDISLAIYSKGLPLSFFDDQIFLKPFEKIRPGISFPTREMLSGELLKLWNERCEDAVTNFLQNYKNYVTLSCDAWTDVNSRLIINYIAMNASTTLFLASVNTGQEGHTAECLFDETSKIINTYPDRIIGCCTDNAPANQKMWKLIEQNYPAKFAYGCNCHALHLLVKDIFNVPNEYKSREEEYPLINFVKIVDDISEFVHMLKKGKEKEIMLQLQKTHKLNKLKVYGETRWGSLHEMFKSFSEWILVLFQQSQNEEWLQSGTVKIQDTKKLLKDKIRDDEFERNLKNAIAITKLININLMKSQSDNYYLSDVCHDWLSIIENITSLNLPEILHRRVTECIQHRWNFIKSTAHILCYQLDIRYKGSLLTRVERDHIRNVIIEYSHGLGEQNRQKIIQELNSFIEYDNNVEYSNARVFWVWNSKYFPCLSAIALRVFSLVPSTSSLERIFKTRGYIHSKIRNRLLDDTWTKLTRIKMNYKLLESQTCKRKFSELDQRNNSDTANSSTTLSTTNQINNNTTVQNQQQPISSAMIDVSDEDLYEDFTYESTSDDDNDEDNEFNE